MKPESGELLSCCGYKAQIAQQVLSPVKVWMKYTYAKEVAAFYTALKHWFSPKMKIIQ